MLMNWGSFANKETAWNMTKGTVKSGYSLTKSGIGGIGWLMNTSRSLYDVAEGSVLSVCGMESEGKTSLNKGLNGLNRSWDDCNRKIKNGVQSLSNKGFSLTNTGNDIKIESDSDLYDYKGEGLDFKVGAKDKEQNSHNEMEINHTMKNLNYVVEEKQKIVERQEKYGKEADGGVAAQIDFNDQDRKRIQNFKDRIIETYKSKWNKIVKENTSRFDKIKTQNGFIIVDKNQEQLLKRTKNKIKLLKENEHNVMNLLQNEIDQYVDMASNSYLETSDNTNVIGFLFKIKSPLESHLEKSFKQSMFDIDYLQ